MGGKNKDAKLIISLRLLSYDCEMYVKYYLIILFKRSVTLHVHSTTNWNNLSANIRRQVRS